ncbi:DNA-directed RNA polymerase I subunit RPA43 [Scleropages formosus]|uniref:DNA-directed RNA polymerase subunit n=1 Tax=Scleropages formosus TaxID=113540 RepID=A0A8C9RMR3_SCLFO|nr:DNA-directed RNA polymerase I subunit RPA43 [Scleropages formosus]
MVKVERAARAARDHEPQPDGMSASSEEATAAAPTAAASSVQPCLVPSFADARALLSAPYSCLVVEGSRRHVALAPLYLHKKRSGIREQLDAELLKYSESMNGVPLAYDDVRVLGRYGDIYDDQGFIHMDIEATFVIFRPKRGQKLLGVINKVGASHVGCLVHGCFNASVAKPHHVSLEAWKRAGLNIGDGLEFEVAQLDADVAGVLLIRGRLDKARIQELMALSNCAEDVSEESAQPETNMTDGVKTKRKKKKDKMRDDEVLQDCCAPEDSPQDQKETSKLIDVAETNMNGQINGKKKKKKKKEKCVEAPEDGGVIEVLASAPGGEEGYKHSKKRKKGLEETEMTPSADTENPKAKRKKVK